MNHLGDANKMVSNTPRTEAEVNRQKCWSDDLITIDANFACQLERELNEANNRIQSLIEERDRANRLAEWKWNLRDEFQLLLGTDKIEEGIEVVKEMKRRIKKLEEESESRWMLAQSATGSCAEMSSRIKRLEEAGDALAKHHLLVVTTYDKAKAHVADWRKAKEAKL